MVGEERDTRDGHYLYRTMPPFDVLHPATWGAQAGAPTAGRPAADDRPSATASSATMLLS